MEFSILSEIQSPKILWAVFLLGLGVGSFINVLVLRLGTGEEIVRVRSHCFACGKTLRWYELLPLLSFIVQRGRCRGCGSRISWQYPVVELVSGLIFSLVAWNIGANFQLSISNFQSIFNYSIFKLLYFWTMFSLLLAISVYDFRHKIIPNQLVYPFILLALFGIFVFSDSNLFRISNFEFRILSHQIFAGAGAFLFFASLWFLSQGRWMGLGDAKLALGIGFLLGPWLTTVAVLLSFWIGTIIAVPLVLWGGRGLKTQIPFGPFLAVGTFVSWLASNTMLEVYRLFLF